MSKFSLNLLFKGNWKSIFHHHNEHSLNKHHLNINNISKNNNPYHSGVLMYSMLFFGYLIFVMSWSGTLFIQSVNTTFDPYASGISHTAINAVHPVFNKDTNTIDHYASGLIYQFFPDGVQLVVSRATNWSLTIGRAIGAVFFGWLITKINHKWSVLIALGLMVCAFPYLLSPFALTYDASGMPTNGAGVYSMFIIFRILMALGGTTLISYTNGVIGVYCRDKSKVFGNLNVFPANVASIIASIFLTSSTISATMALNWQVFGGFLECLMLVLFLGYLFLGQKIDLTDKKLAIQVDQMTQKSFHPKSTNPMLEVMRKKETWFFLISALFLSYITVEPGTQILSSFWTYSPNNKLANPNLAWIFGGFNIAFLAGVFLGMFTVGRWLRTKYSYNKYTAVMFFFGVLFIAAGVAIGYDGLDDIHVAFILIMTFIGSTFLFGVNGIFYAMPYRWGFTPGQITALISLLFGVSYCGYTILDIITSYIMDAGLSAYNPDYPNSFIAGNGVGAIPAVCVMLILPIIGIISIALLPKEKDAIPFSFKDLYGRYIKKNIN